MTGNIRHTLQKYVSPLKALQEALRAKYFVSVGGTLMLDLGFRSLSATTRTSSKLHLANVPAV